MIPIFKEIADFYRFFWKTPKEKKEIVFYSEHKDYYPYFEGLINELLEKYCLSLCYVTSEANDPILQKTESRLKTFYSNKLLPFFMGLINCKVFVMTLADLNQFHLMRSHNSVHYAYIFHALVSTHMVYRGGAFDHYDSILCCGPHHIKEIRKHEELNGLQPKRLVESGYYRLERIYESYQKYCHRKPSPDNKKTILVAPSHGTANVLESCGISLINILLEANYKVIVRPHPETIRHSLGIIALLTSKFDDNPDFILEMSVATDDSLLKADALICDYSGVALEYAFGTERPVLFLDVPKKVKNDKYEEIEIKPIELSIRPKIGTIIAPERLDEVPSVISSLITDRELYRKRLTSLRKQNVYNFGQSSEIGAEFISGIVNDKNGRGST